MADQDALYKIKIVTTADTSGAVETQQAQKDLESGLEGIEKAAQKSTESTHSLMGEQLGSLRTASHLFHGVKEIAEGGQEAVAGLATEVRIAAEVFESMLGPAAPFIIILSTLLAVGIPALSKAFGDTGGAAKEGAKGTDELAKSLDEISKAKTEEAIKRVSDALRDQLSVLQANTKEMQAQDKASGSLLSAQQELADAKISSRLADLDEQEGIDLSGKDADQALKIKQDYAQKRQALKQEIDRDKAAQDVQEKQAGVEAAKQALIDNHSESRLVEGGVQDAHQVINAGGPAGLKSDAEVATERLAQLRKFSAEGENGRSISPREEQELLDLQSKVPQMQQTESIKGKDFTEGLKQLQNEMQESRARELDALSSWHVGADGVRVGAEPERATQERGNQGKISDAIDAINKYVEELKAARAKLDDKDTGVAKLQELRAKDGALQAQLGAAQAKLETAQTNADKVGTVQRTETFSLDQDQTKETAQRAFENREVKRKQQSDDLDAKIKAASDALIKGVLEKQKAGIEAAGERDRAQTQLAAGKIGKSEYDEMMEHAYNTSVNASTLASKQDAAAEAKLAAAQVRTSDRSARDVGTDAEQLIKSLNPSHQLAQEAHGAVQQLDKGSSQAAAQLEGILSQLVGTTKNLTQDQSDLFRKILDRLKAVEQDLRTHGNQINTLKN